MRTIYCLLLALASLAGLVMAEGDVLFPYMYGLNYTEYDEAKKLGFTPYACKSEDEWNKMTTADFAKYKSIIIPDCLCNTSLNTIQFLDNTKKVWSPAVTGNMVLIGTDPSYHSKWYKLAGASAMIRDSISLASTGKNGTGMYFSLSCYYQSKATPTKIEALSEIGDFTVRGNLTCLNKAHIVATDESMTSLTDAMASNWNCSVHEVFAEYPTTGNGAFEPLAIALNTTGLGERTFADGTHGTPYIIARGATPLGCGNNVTDTEYSEECDYGKANGLPDSDCSSSCKCLFGMISPGLCRQNITSSSSTSISSSTTFYNTSSIPLSTRTPTNTSLPTSMLYTNSSTAQTKTKRPPVTITVWPSRPSWIPTSSLAPTSSTASPSSNSTSRSDADTPTATVTYSWPPSPSSDITTDTDTDPGTAIVTASGDPGTVTTNPAPSASAPNTDDGPETVIVTASDNGSSSSASPTSSSSLSKSDGTDGGPPETVIVTASGDPPGSEPGTVTVWPPSGTASDSAETGSMSATSGKETDDPVVTVTAGGPDNGGQVSSSSSGSGPVTVTAEVPESPTNGQNPSLSGTTSYPPGSDVPSWSSIKTSPQVTLTVRPSGGEGSMSGSETASGLPKSTVTVYPSGRSSGGGDAGNGPGVSSSPPGTTSGTASRPPQSTVTVYPSGQTSDRGGDGNGPGGSQTRSTKTLTVGGGSATAPGFSEVSGSTNRGLGSTSWIGGLPGSSTNTAPGGGGMGTASGTSGGSSETNTADPLNGSSTGMTMTASGTVTGSASGSPSASSSGGVGSSGSLSPSGSSSRSNLPSLTGSITTSTLAATSGTNSGTPVSSSLGTTSAISPNPDSGTSLGSGASYSFASSSAISSNQGGSGGSISGSATISGSILPSSVGTDCGPSATTATSVSPSSTPECDTWVGIEIIHIIELVEICPKGSTVTETKTEHLSTLTRSICATPTPSHPCYPCIFGTPSASDNSFTITVTSCPSSPKTTVTVTVQMCSTCTTTTYVGTVPGHTPGGDCHGCYGPGSGEGSTTVTATETATATATEVVTLSTEGPFLTGVPVPSIVPSSVGDEGAGVGVGGGGGGGGGGGEGYGPPPASTSSVPAAGGYGPPPLPPVPVGSGGGDGSLVTSQGSVVTASNTPYKPTTTSSVVTAGVGRKGCSAIGGVLAAVVFGVMFYM